MREKFLQILHDEVKPALGCTEPGAVALAAAKARETLGEPVKKADIAVSANIFKNGMCVGIPGTSRIGLTIAAALGLEGGDSSLGLNVLKTLTPEMVSGAEKMMDEKIVKVTCDDEAEKVYVKVVLQGETSTVELISAGKHDNIVYIKKNDEIIFNNYVKAVAGATTENIFDQVTLKSLIETVETFTEEEIGFLWDGLEMNKAMAMYGLEHEVGGQVGRSIQEAIKKGDMKDDFLAHAMLWTTAAADARMSGANISVMSSNGSGNHGLTAILPIAAYDDMFHCERLKVLKALAMSHLMTAFVKSYTGRLSAVCGCGVAAAIGAALGLAYLMDLGYDGMERAVDLMIAGDSGMICDGAKAGCAVKLAIASSSAVQSCYMAKYFTNLPKFNGIVGHTVEESIRNLGTVCSQGMVQTDKVILDVMNGMNH